MICRDCQEEFEKKIFKDRGFKDQCDECSESDKTVRVLGYNDGSLNKATNIALYKGDDPRVRKSIQFQRARTGGL